VPSSLVYSSSLSSWCFIVSGVDVARRTSLTVFSRRQRSRTFHALSLWRTVRQRMATSTSTTMCNHSRKASSNRQQRHRASARQPSRQRLAILHGASAEGDVKAMLAKQRVADG
jgi:hypothetical protein